MVTTSAEIGEVLAEARAEFLAIANDIVEITKAGVGEPTGPDPVTMKYTYPPRVVVYRGPCRLQVKADINSNVVEATAGEREATYLTAQLQVPIEDPPDVVGSVADIRPDNVAEMVTVAHDPTLVGREFNIQGIYHKSQAGYRRYRVREVIA